MQVRRFGAWYYHAATVIFVADAFSFSRPGNSPSYEISFIGGQRCLKIPATKPNEQYPTLVLLGGIAQTISSWEHHLPNLSKKRQVLVYECVGQGPPSKILDYHNATLPFQAQRLVETLELVDPNRPVDIVGFSFGARVAMAAKCLYPERIRKLHLTGVGVDRSDYGHLALKAWKDSILSDRTLRAFAWSVLLATYSPAFLRSQGPRIERFIEHISTTNHAEGLLALLEQAEISDPNDAWHVLSMAERLQGGIIGESHICVGEFDQMAPVSQAQQLCQLLESGSHPSVIPNCGHAVGLESPRQWRENVLTFLD
jgi:pimeloyl-ACP methyl ester carboxylesterase